MPAPTDDPQVALCGTASEADEPSFKPSVDLRAYCHSGYTEHRTGEAFFSLMSLARESSCQVLTVCDPDPTSEVEPWLSHHPEAQRTSISPQYQLLTTIEDEYQ